MSATRILRGIPTGYSANEKLNVAQIGVTGKGAADLKGVTEAGGNIVALCDFDEHHLATAARQFTRAKQHADFRKMLDSQKDIDAVVVTIPDHQHAVAAMAAMMRGKHVYCQKPLTHDIYEARVLRDAARKYKVATQMGNQGHANEPLRTQVDWIRAGVLGQVHDVHLWTNRPIWPQGADRPTDTPPVPTGLDWDLWLGTAPQRPYSPAYHPFKWRGFWDFGTGALGDMGCHIIDIPFWALDLGGNCTVEAESGGQTLESGPKWSIVTWRFPARGKLVPLVMKWYDGGKLPIQPAGMSDEAWNDAKEGGVIFIGDKGVMAGSRAKMPNVLGEYGKDLKPPDRTIPTSPGHYVEWLEACKGGPAAGTNFDYATPLTETVLLGNLAIRVGKPIAWDSAHMKVTNHPEANALIRREYRKGWGLDAIEA
ncbi:MAG TPA: Gfo/Idh/MocA family oxidoreductase [Tepidisphaeraceae bacterium]|jgi:predicted dehydrogenase